jgi:solute:Na+ symporter, SSS family
MQKHMTGLDWAIIAIYLLAIVGLGVAAGFLRRKGERGGEGGHYFLAGNTLAWPVIGLAMLAAAMQTCSATLVAYDLFKRHNPALSDHQLVTIGKVTTVVGTLIAIVSSPLFGQYKTIFEGLNKLICYIAPPITAVFLVGVFWKKASGRAAFLTLIAGSAMGSAMFVTDF